MLRKLVKHIILIINVCFVVLLFVSGSACLLNPAKYTIVALLGLGFPIFVIINIAFVVWWAVCRKKLFLLSLLALLPFVPRYVEFPFNDNKEAVNGTPIRIMSYNAHNFGLSKWPDHKKTMAEMVEFIGCENLDIACFQEYSTGERNLPTHQKLMEKFKYSHLYITMDTYNRGDTRNGLATYSNYPIVGYKDIMSDGETSNAIIYTDIKIGDDTIRVFNTHLQSNKFSPEEYLFIEKVNSLNSDVYDKDKIDENKRGLEDVFHRMKGAYEWRVRQAETLADYAGNSPYPVVICGDFNETQSSYVYRLVSKNHHDSHKVACNGWKNTYRRFFPGLRIDYIIYDNPLKCQDFKVPQVDFSDHRPVVGEYSIN